MTDRKKIKKLIQAGEIRKIFIHHLGWDNASEIPFPLTADFGGESHAAEITPVAQKRGFVVCTAKCKSIPPKTVWQKLRRKLSLVHYEHLLVLQDDAGNQVWVAAVKHPDKPICFAEVQFSVGQSPDIILEKLDSIGFSLSEEEGLTVRDVSGRVEEAFALHAKKVTREFYEKFKRELENFQKFVRGLQAQVDRDQYAALMLNRLMFIYFIQSKKFLGNDASYLQTRLREHREESAKGESFYRSFYRHFLMTLFHRGLGAPQESRDAEVRQQIGQVPYLNGGLFDMHELEKQYNEDLDIEDAAFDRIFNFFDEYDWRLDNRPTASGKDINPDVIGHIFEKYINDRAQKGAYYTQEDITGYIARNTILPHLLRQVQKDCPTAFRPRTGWFWNLLREKPDNYIHDAVGKGGLLLDADLPKDIRVGMDEHAPDLLKRRVKWNTAAAEEWALPTETWREALTRRARFWALKAKLEGEGISDIADLTTYNLDIEKLTIHALQDCKDADFITAFYTALAGFQKKGNSPVKSKRGISVLDPACGSGAFLFAALNVLQPLYSQCIARMEEFVADDDVSGKNSKPNKVAKSYEWFRGILKEMDSHPSKEYGIYRSIILGNLFGVDIMPEAVEVAKLRLFLKLAAVAEKDDSKPNMGLDPLPDIDFNIRTGNTLVGFANFADFNKVAKAELKFGADLIKQIDDDAEAVGMAYNRFVEAQTITSAPPPPSLLNSRQRRAIYTSNCMN